jgi:hypothetical protein
MLNAGIPGLLNDSQPEFCKIPGYSETLMLRDPSAACPADEYLGRVIRAHGIPLGGTALAKRLRWRMTVQPHSKNDTCGIPDEWNRTFASGPNPAKPN